MYEHLNDRELLFQFQTGDSQAFDEFHRRHVNSALDWAARFKVPRCDLDLAIQNAFLGIARLTDVPRNPAAYLHAAVRKNVVNLLQRRKSHEERYPSLEFVDEDDPALEYEDENNDTSNAIDAALGQLPPHERDVVACLRQGWTVTRTSEHLGVCWETVQRRRDRAFVKLRVILA